MPMALVMWLRMPGSIGHVTGKRHQWEESAHKHSYLTFLKIGTQFYEGGKEFTFFS